MESAAGMPGNLVSQRLYRGINVFLLSASKHVSPFWLTLRQANQFGGHVRKGERSQIVVFWKVDRVAGDNEIEPDSEHGGLNRTVAVSSFDISGFGI